MGASSRGARWPSRWTSLCRCPQFALSLRTILRVPLHPLHQPRYREHQLPMAACHGMRLACSWQWHKCKGAFAGLHWV